MKETLKVHEKEKEREKYRGKERKWKIEI